MSSIGTWLATTPLGSAFKVFLAGLFAAVMLTWTSEGQISWDHWTAWVVGALALAIPPVINWLNPKDTRYGRGSTS